MFILYLSQYSLLFKLLCNPKKPLVPVEHFSFSTMDVIAAAASLITLFSTCVQCFECFQAARSFPRKFDLLLVKLDVEKVRLIAWGDAVGLLGPGSEERVSRIRDIPVVERSLREIKALLDDAQRLREKYGLIKQSCEKTAINLDGENDLGAESGLTLEGIGDVVALSADTVGSRRNSKLFPDPLRLRKLSGPYMTNQNLGPWLMS